MSHLVFADMCEHLNGLGLTRRYKPFNDPSNVEREKGTEIIALECRRPAAIVGGAMNGSSVEVYDGHTVRVWTSKKAKAMRIARENGFRVRLLDGEAELFIPTNRADEFLHGLGAKVRTTRAMTPEQRAAATARLAKARQDRKVNQAVGH